MQISLKQGERIFINGAVLKVDRKVSIELLNDVTFLLESHVLQADDATTPLRQLYFIVQTMLMEPANAETSKSIFEKTYSLILTAFENEEILEGLRSVGRLVAAEKIFDALKMIRSLYRIEKIILSNSEKNEQISADQEREVA